MGYQALLFCTDEKLARVVSQLFSELEFSVSPISDPFAAVKNLMAQHYDAVVIDCENEQSASLMIKSARNSTFNQGSLAIGLVEGQAGVAKAYRMGANLVLTKPINVEAAKGTLRVARGLLRKGTEGTPGGQGAVAPGTAVGHSSGASFASTNQSVGASSASSASNADSQYRSGVDSSKASAPTTPHTAFANSEQTPALTPAVPLKPWTSIGSTVPAAQAPATTAQINAPQTWARPEASETTAARLATMPIASPTTKSRGAGAAPAPAKIAVPPHQPVYEEEREEFAEDESSTPRADFSASGAAMQSPSFSMETEHAGRSGGSQKILIGAVAVLLLIGAYFGWTKFGQSNPVPAPVAAVPQAPPDAGSSHATPTPAQSSPAATNHGNVAITAPGHATASTQPSHAPANTSPTTQASTTAATATPAGAIQPGATQPGVTQAGATQATATQVAATVVPSESSGTKAPAPILVKPGITPKTHSQAQSQNEEASAQLPNPLAVAPAEGGVSGVLTAASAPAKPSLAIVKISQGVSQGLLIKRVEPQYPRNALATRTQGTVLIEATVDKEGRVVNPKVLSGPFMLAPAALEAVRQWRYKPYYLNGEPVEIQTQITINFKTH